MLAMLAKFEKIALNQVRRNLPYASTQKEPEASPEHSLPSFYLS